MNPFDTAAVLIATTGVSGYVTHRFLKLPATSDTPAVALVSSLVVVPTDAIVPARQPQAALTGFLGWFDFNEELVHGMLCLLICQLAARRALGAAGEHVDDQITRHHLRAALDTGSECPHLMDLESRWRGHDLRGLPRLRCVDFADRPDRRDEPAREPEGAACHRGVDRRRIAL